MFEFNLKKTSNPPTLHTYVDCRIRQLRLHLLLGGVGDLRAAEVNPGQVGARVGERLGAHVGDLRAVEVNRGQVGARVGERLGAHVGNLFVTTVDGGGVGVLFRPRKQLIVVGLGLHPLFGPLRQVLNCCLDARPLLC